MPEQDRSPSCHGQRGLMPTPGALARIYEGLGGTVHYVGKPHPAICRRSDARAPLGDTPAGLVKIRKLLLA